MIVVAGDQLDQAFTLAIASAAIRRDAGARSELFAVCERHDLVLPCMHERYARACRQTCVRQVVERSLRQQQAGSAPQSTLHELDGDGASERRPDQQIRPKARERIGVHRDASFEVVRTHCGRTGLEVCGEEPRFVALRAALETVCELHPNARRRHGAR